MAIGAGPDASPPGPRLREPWRPGPLAGRYPAAAAMVILFLVPYLGLSAALPPLTPIIAGQLHMSLQTLSLTSGMANAAYAVGTVLAVQFAQHLPQRRMLLIYGALLVVGSVLAAAAAGPAMFIAGHVLQGLCTSLLLVAAAPPLLLGYPATRLRWSAVILNMCLFGAVTAGPLIGGAQASFHAWRPLFWIVAGIAAAGLLMSLLTFQDAPPADRGAPRDGLAIGLAAAGSVAAFWGAAELTTHRFLAPVAVAPLLGGLALIIVLWVYQYRARNPLLTLRSLASTIPMAGTVVAICAAAASTFAVTLAGLPTAAMGTALWICFALSAGGALAGVLLYLFGGVRPSAPSVQRWMDGQEPAWTSPPLLAAIRHRPLGRVPAGRLAAALPDRDGARRLAEAPAGPRPRHQARGYRPGPVLFGYDGSELAKAAIIEAGRQLPAHRDALVVTVWRTFNVEFVPEPGTRFDAACADEVRQAAEQTAARGALLAEAAGFRAQGIAVEGTPTSKAIMDAADDHDASLIVLGSRGRAGLGGLLVGSAAGAVAAHSRRPVLIVHDHSTADTRAPGTAPPASPIRGHPRRTAPLAPKTDLPENKASGTGTTETAS